MIRNKTGRKIAFFAAVFFRKISEYIYKNLQKSDIPVKNSEETDNLFQSSPYPEEWAEKVAVAGNISWVEFSINRPLAPYRFANNFPVRRKESENTSVKKETLRQGIPVEKTEDNSPPKSFNRKTKVWVENPSGTNPNEQVTDTENHPKLSESGCHDSYKETQQTLTELVTEEHTELSEPGSHDSYKEAQQILTEAVTEEHTELSEPGSHDSYKEAQQTLTEAANEEHTELSEPGSHDSYKEAQQTLTEVANENSPSFTKQKKQGTENNKKAVKQEKESSSENISLFMEKSTKSNHLEDKNKRELPRQQFEKQKKTTAKEMNITESLFLRQNTFGHYEKNGTEMSERIKHSETKNETFPDLKPYQNSATTNSVTTEESKQIHLRNVHSPMTDNQNSIIEKKNNFFKKNYDNSKGIWPELPAISQKSQLNYPVFDEKDRISFLEREQKGEVWSVLRF